MKTLRMYQLVNRAGYKDWGEQKTKIDPITMIDTISNMLGVIDGSSTLKDCSLEPKLLLASIDTKGELQDSFLEFIEERDGNS
ncbi:hypothetical protein [Paenibacillus gallinarum]|uniref:hypothetical protein n=1 Tax=Paenibacillus gallinarum TaxID=2762232 RepID=UPI001CD8B58A|nr:hypothetical protein [Paenibacillus gallinarum]